MTRVRIEHAIPLIGQGIKAVLSSSCEFEVIASAACDDTADVLVTDIDTALRAPPVDGSACPNVLIVAQDDGEAPIRKALAKGVRGFLLHTCGVEELTKAVQTLSRGGTAFAPLLAGKIVQSLTCEQLTEREMDVVHLLVQGASDKDMARKLHIAPGTVKAHMKSILRKLGATRRTEAAAIAQRRGLARLDPALGSDAPM